jgi:hypothetical protein
MTQASRNRAMGSNCRVFFAALHDAATSAGQLRARKPMKINRLVAGTKIAEYFRAMNTGMTT